MDTWIIFNFQILQIKLYYKIFVSKMAGSDDGHVSFLEKLLKFSKAVEHFTFPSAMRESSNFSTSSATFGMGQSSDFYIDMYDIFSFCALSLNSALWIAEGLNFDEAQFIHHIFSIVFCVLTIFT